MRWCNIYARFLRPVECGCRLGAEARARHHTPPPPAAIRQILNASPFINFQCFIRASMGGFFFCSSRDVIALTAAGSERTGGTERARASAATADANKSVFCFFFFFAYHRQTRDRPYTPFVRWPAHSGHGYLCFVIYARFSYRLLQHGSRYCYITLGSS